MLLFLSLLVLPICVNGEQSKAPVNLSIQNDGREWVIDRDENLDGQGIVEYILKDESKNNWTELVTIQYFWSDSLDPKELFKMFMNDLKNHAGNAEVSETIIEEKDRDVIAKWEVEGTAEDQQEVIRIMGDGRIVAIVRYTVKKDKVDPEKLKKWTDIIKNASLNSSD